MKNGLVKYGCIVIFLLLIGFEGFGQAYRHRQFTSKNGLASDNVFCMVQDQNGFLWFGTALGLSSFDGKYFVNFAEEEGLRGLSITSLLMGQNDTLIAGFYRGGIQRVVAHRVLPIKGSSEIFDVSSEMIFWGNEIVSTGQNFLFQLNDQGNKHEYITNFYDCGDSTLISSNAKDEVSIKANVLPIDTDNFLLGSGKGILAFEYPNTIRGFCANAIDSIYTTEIIKGRDGSFWIGSLGSIYQVKNCQIVQKISNGIPAGKLVQRMLIDKAGSLWLSVQDHGLFRFNTAKQELVNVSKEFGVGNSVHFLFQDREGNIWVCTRSKGVVQIMPSLFQRLGAEDGFCSDQIGSLAQDQKGYMYIGTNAGVNVMYQDRIFSLPSTALNCDDGKYIHDVRYQAPYGLLISSLSGFNRGAFKGIDWHIPIYALRSRSDYFLGPDTLLSADSWLRPIPNGGRVNAYTLKSPIYSVADIDTSRTFFAPDLGADVRKIFVDDQKRIWASTGGNLFQIVKNEGTYELQKIAYPTEKFGLPPRLYTYNILQGPDHVVWLFTNNGIGLYKDGDWDWLSQKDGLGSDNCYTAAFDPKGYTWIGTKEGLFKYDGKNFFLIGEETGLTSSSIGSLLIDTISNKLWLGSVNGLFHASLSDLDPIGIPTELPVFIREVAVDAARYFFPKRINLSPQERNFQIYFSALNLSTPERIQYQYKFSNKEEKWKTTNSNRIDYAFLDDGKYTLQLRASIDGYNWTPATQLDLRVYPPFYKSPFFYAMMSLLGMLIIGIVALNMVRATRKREKEKRLLLSKVNHLEQQALGASLNKHFIFNALNSIQYHLNTHKTQEANEYLATFARLIRMNLDIAPKHMVALEEELDRIKLYLELENLRFDNLLDYQIRFQGEVDQKIVLIPSMVLQPYVENAIWHGILPKKTAGHIDISFEIEDDQWLWVSIMDNGIGYEQSKKRERKKTHISRGMEITRQRLQLMGPEADKSHEPILIEELKAADGSPAGTLVKLCIPLRLSTFS